MEQLINEINNIIAIQNDIRKRLNEAENQKREIEIQDRSLERRSAPNPYDLQKQQNQFILKALLSRASAYLVLGLLANTILGMGFAMNSTMLIMPLTVIGLSATLIGTLNAYRKEKSLHWKKVKSDDLFEINNSLYNNKNKKQFLEREILRLNCQYSNLEHSKKQIEQQIEAFRMQQRLQNFSAYSNQINNEFDSQNVSRTR